ncbi:MAG: alpha-amylase family glycosyl hydrolase, partial [Prevotella sp.]|nr:alpha-amylase family glycosyl hydrolase [Prevotella sp.]
MKIIFSLALTVLFSLFSFSCLHAQGWPEKYNGVMIQGFYWDSYQDTQWNDLESQADELAEYFNLIWIPQSGYCNTLTSNMGYCDIWWLDHKSAFGTEAQLRSMIKTFKAKGLGTIADVVINHKSGNTNWTDFPDEKVVGQNTGKTYTITWGGNCAPYICKTDECVKSGYKATGVADSGDDFNGSRDLDHSNLTVQNNIKVYLDFLLNELGYTGFRYDMVKGYAPKYTSIYNTSAKPQFSVGECWDGYARVTSWINGTKDASGKIQSA